MPSVTGTDLKNILNADETATQLEYVMDLAIDALNVFNCGISNMSGSAGSKTVTLTSAQRGAVFLVARNIYASFFKNAGNTNNSVNSIGLTNTDLMSNPTIVAFIKTVASQLIGRSFERA